jgi:hypothetical protein
VDVLDVADPRDTPPLRSARWRPQRYGAQFDLGVPDGATIAFVVAPVRTIDVSGGISYNAFSFGVRGGGAWTPLRGRISPTLSVDVGHFAEGDANPLARLVSGNSKFSSAALDRIGYDYADAASGSQPVASAASSTCARA